MTANVDNALPRWARWRGTELVIDVHVQPGARRSVVLGEHGGRLKVAIHAPAAEGKANAELLRLLGDVLHLRPSALHLAAGASSRQKSIGITAGCDEATTFVRKLVAAMQAP